MPDSFASLFGKVQDDDLVVKKIPEEKQESFDLDEIVQEAIEADDPIIFLLEKNIKFNKELALILIKIGLEEHFINYLLNFEGLDQEVALELLKGGQDIVVAAYLNAFKDIDHKKIALKLIKINNGNALARYLREFKGLDKEIALALIKVGQGLSVAEHFNMFEGLDKEVALKLIEAGQVVFVGKYFYKFEGLSVEDQKGFILTMLVDRGFGDLLNYFNKSLTYLLKNKKEIVCDILEILNNRKEKFVDNFSKLSTLPAEGQKEVVLVVLKKQKSVSFDVNSDWGSYLATHFSIFLDLPVEYQKEIVLAIIAIGGVIGFIRNFEKLSHFSAEDQKDVALAIVEWHGAGYLANDFEKLLALSSEGQKEVVFAIIADGGAGELIDNFEKLSVLLEEDKKEVILAIVLKIFEYKEDGDFEFKGDMKELEGGIKKISISSNDILDNVLEHFNEEGNEESITNIYLYLAQKKDWQELLGKQELDNFLNTLPKDKQRDEKRNAFTRNEYDRTSQFLQYVNNEALFFVNKEELEIAGEYIKKYGLAKQSKLYEYFRNIKLLENGKIEELPEKQIGDEIQSLDILEEKYKKIQELVFSDKELLAEGLNKLGFFEIELLNHITGKSSHSFHGNGRTIEDMIENFNFGYENEDYYEEEYDDDEYGDYNSEYNNQIEEKHISVPEEYKTINIKSFTVSYEFDAEKLKAEDSYYNILKAEILDSFDLEKEDDVKLEKLMMSVKEKIELKKRTLEGKKDIPYVIKQLEFYDDLLEKISSVKSYDELLIQILRIDKGVIGKFHLKSDLRKIIFRKTLDKRNLSGQNIEELRKHLLNSELSGKSLFSLLNLMDNLIKDHVLNLEGRNKEEYWTEEAWEQIVKSKKDKKLASVLKIFNPYLKELREEVENLKVVETGKGNVNIDCYPDRGLIGEMSGYLGNACYTAVYPLLARYPNLIPYKFIDNTDPENKEFLGSVLVFELESKEGEKVALLRAFDVPDESKVNMEKFIEDFIENISSSLKARGIEKIIIPGESGAISNYAMTLRHMHKNYINDKTPMSLSERFVFNGHDITNNCYVARNL